MKKCDYCGYIYNDKKIEVVTKKIKKKLYADKVTTIKCARCGNLLYGQVEHIPNILKKMKKRKR